MSEKPWSSDSEILAKGVGSDAERLTDLIDNAAARATAGDWPGRRGRLNLFEACSSPELL
jgi:hypothetical protein